MATASILLVDDHAANLTALEAILAPLGHIVRLARSGQEALERIREEDFAVVLLDVCMPDMDGFEVATRIKAHPRTRRVPVIFLTAADLDVKTVSQAYAQGAVDFLCKPFDAAALRSKVAVFVELYLQAEQNRYQSTLLRRRERERMEEQIAHRFRGLTDLLPLCVWAATRDGRIHYCNHAWLSFTGLTIERANQVDHLEVIHPDDRARVTEAWQAAVESGKQLVIEYRLRRARDGMYRWHLGRVVPELGRRGAIIGWVATATDIEEQKRAERMLVELAESAEVARVEAETANRMKDQFLATVSHELRTPLNAIFGWTRMLRAGKLDARSTEKALETIERNTKIQAQLVEDLLDVSRIVSGKLHLDVKPIAPSDFVRAAIEATRLTAEAKGLELVRAIDDTPCRMDGDFNRLEQVVWNLLSNAIKFTPKGGRIFVRTGVDPVERVVQVEVRDTGHGIDPDFLPHIFDRFRQADSTTTRQQGGLGLGLAIVKHIVELHHGDVKVTSAGYGQGAHFAVRLPLAEVGRLTTPTVRTAESGSFDEVPSLRGISVVVVDDDDDARELMATVLQEFGAQVIGCSSAEAAFAEVERVHPAVLISDVGMPGEDGYSLMRRIRALPAEKGGQIKAIALTGFARPEDSAAALSAGFQLHMTKPVDPARLLAVIGELTRKSPRKSQHLTLVG